MLAAKFSVTILETTVTATAQTNIAKISTKYIAAKLSKFEDPVKSLFNSSAATRGKASAKRLPASENTRTIIVPIIVDFLMILLSIFIISADTLD